MTTFFREHSHHYAVLALILALGIAGIAWFRSNLPLQQLVLWGTLLGYVIWGIGHHMIRKDLTMAIILEYLLIAGIAGYFTQSVLLNR